MRYSHGLSWIAQWPSGVQQFQAAGGSGVAFTKVRVVLNNPDGSIALDTVIAFPAGATELQVTLSVPLPASAPASGQPLALNLDYQNAAGQSVFHGGPVTVVAMPNTPGAGPPAPSTVTIPIRYTGPGAQATQVRITPKTLSVSTGQGFQYAAQALDASGSVVPNAPIVFASQNTIIATVNAITGAGVAGTSRGVADIVAQLFNGGTDQATLTVVPPPANLAAVSGGGQTAPVNSLLPQPVAVHLTAADGIGSAGVPVTFAVGSGGGSVGAATVTTDADGNAQTTWRLGSTAGAQTVTASAAGVSGSPITFAATARATDPVRVAIATQPPTTTQAGTAFGLVANAVDGTGAVTPLFTGAVTVALTGTTPTGAVLTGTTTTNAVAGVVTFSDLRLNVPGTYTLAVTSPSLAGATTSSFVTNAGAANRLAFQNYPIVGAIAGSTFDPITVEVRDALNNRVTTFTGPVTLTLGAAAAAMNDGIQGVTRVTAAGSLSANAVLSGTTTVNTVAGVATFSGIALTTAGAYQLLASATGLTGAAGPVFAITPGPATTLALVSGGAQSAPGAATLPLPIVVRVIDGFGNLVDGKTVTFSPTAGSVTVTSIVAGGGTAQTVWTLGAFAGAQTLNVTSPGLNPNPLAITATATTAAGIAHTWTGVTSTSWNDPTNWSTGSVPTATDDVVIPTGIVNKPRLQTAPGYAHNLTIASGMSVETTCAYELYVYGNLVAPLGAPAGLTCEGDAIHLMGDGTPGGNTVVGNFEFLTVEAPYKVSGPGNQVIVGLSWGRLFIDGTNGGILTLNGGRVDAAQFATANNGKLVMNNPADQLFLTSGHAYFNGGSTNGLLTAGTITFTGYGCLYTQTGAPNAFAPSGTHKVVFAGTNNCVSFAEPTMSYFMNVTVNGGTTLSVETNNLSYPNFGFNANGTLTRGAGAGTMTITGYAGTPRMHNVAGLNITGGATTFDNIGMRLLVGTANATFNTVAFTGFAGWTGPILKVNRNSPEIVTFNALDFSAVGVLGGGGVFLENSNTATVNIRGSNPGTGILGTHYTITSTGTVSWIP